jgi:asparagine synthase (glutamine-hydrolysing)
MCGIVAVMSFDGQTIKEEPLKRMRDAMVHRGPDDAGLYLDGSIGLGHRRLSIIDLSSDGHQPMPNEDQSVWLVFNGEIYNYVELRAELLQRGHRFRSKTDSEVIIHLYEELGARCVSRLNGMFAFAIWDARKRLLFGARDRLGIKPFYYYHDHRRFICASEIKAILEDRTIEPRPDATALADYMFAGAPLGAKTPFLGIRQLAPGHSMQVREGRVSVEKYWDVEFKYDFRRSHEQTVNELSALLDDAVRVHCRSDAPLGCHLSGGLDSSTVVGLAARYHQNELKTFSIRFRDATCDESHYARLVAQAMGTHHFDQEVGPDRLARLLAPLTWHLDTPMLPGMGGFSYYAVSRLASEHVKVSLTGHGGDEVFAGYPAQFKATFGHVHMFESMPAVRSVPPLAKRVWDVFRHQGVAALIRRAASRLRPTRPTLEDAWVRLHCGFPPKDNRLLHPQLVRQLNGYSPRAEYLEPLKLAATSEPLDRCLYHDMRFYLPGLLHQEDRTSMAVSLESRVPLLDHRIVEFLATVPPLQKVPAMVPKGLLREAAGPWLPAAVKARRDKFPFPVPVEAWFAEDLAPFVRDLTQGPASLERGFFNPDVLRSGELGPWELWSAMTIEMWARVFLDRDPEMMARVHAARRHVAALAA